MQRSIILMLSLLFFLSACNTDLKKVNAPTDIILYINDGGTKESIVDSMQGKVKDIISFQRALDNAKFNIIYPGRYTFKKGTTNEAMIQTISEGKQDEIEITVGNYASIFELASKLSAILRASDRSIIDAIAARPEAAGKDSLQMIYFLAPNTYRFHWTNTPAEIVEKMAQPYQKFWTEEKRNALKSSNRTELEIITLASIIQMESYKVDEQPKVAGAYINRLQKGMKLDADPTVIFAKKAATGEWDKKVKKVYFKDLNQSSKYNTYRNPGLPPGPICMPNPSAINAALHPESHPYIYFVADTSRPGYHLFTDSYTEHEKNADIYRTWLKNQGIK